MAFATDTDLEQLLPTIFDHGINTFDTELAQAEDDIIRKIQVKWSNRVRGRLQFDESLLTESQWRNAALYRALGYYIMPKLSQWREEGDSFQNQIKFYEKRFAEEMEDQFSAGIEYDEDSSGDLDEGEYNEILQTRLYR